MIRIVGLLITLAFLNESVSFMVEGSSPNVSLADSVEIETHPVFDSLGLLGGYQAYIFTPICEKDICYAVEIEFTWDPIGRFVGYDTIPGQGLTKLDHKPFTDEDYVKLQNILSNPNSVLAKYSKDGLVKDTRTSEVDGVTGATIQEVKDNVIEGAVYSCYTLWHLAHGSVVDSMQQSTVQMFDQPLIDKLVNIQDQEINYFLINHFEAKDFTKYLTQVLKTIDDGKGYYPKNTIEKMPVNVVRDSLSQRFFADKFSGLNYFSQIALLKKLDSASLSNELAQVLRKEISDRESYKNDLIKGLLTMDL